LSDHNLESEIVRGLSKRARNSSIAVLLVVAGLTSYALWPREPISQGQPLSAWLQELVELDQRHHETREDSKIWEIRRQKPLSAVREIGPRAIPHLLRWLRYDSGISIHDRIEELLDRQSLVEIKMPQRPDHSAQIIAGFRVLGESATPALPRLSKLFLKPQYSDEAGACLDAIGPAGLLSLARALPYAPPYAQRVALEYLTQPEARLSGPILSVILNGITNANSPLGAQELLLAGRLGVMARDISPWLVSAMLDLSSPCAGAAMRVLSEVSERPEQYRSLFSERLTRTNFAADAAFALARTGPDGVAPLLRALTNQNQVIQNAAMAALCSSVRKHGVSAASAQPDVRFSIANMNFEYRQRKVAGLSRTRFKAPAISLLLAELLDHREVMVRVNIVQLLGRYGRYGALGLSRAANDADPRVRAAAETELTRLEVEVREGAILRGPKNKKEIALLFTGHEHAEGGEIILDELARHSGHASFFLTGNFLANRDFRPFIRRLCQEGHYLGPHSDKHLLYCSWEEPKKTLLTREQFDEDFGANLGKVGRFPNAGALPAYFVPPYEHANLDIVEWAGDYWYATVNLTPGTRSNADYTGEADENLVSANTIFESIIDRENRDPNGLNGFFLLFHIGSGPRRTDKFHTRFGELLDRLGSKGYKFVAVDEMFEPEAAQARRNLLKLRSFEEEPPSTEAGTEAHEQRYGLERYRHTDKSAGK
jgi:peptidoglycan/xylan/chitin deacetylase (PgdA/CDA1 family)